jgi:cyclic pyranopterin phosphate synthase
MSAEKLTHLDDRGHARMVDVGSKGDTRRTAVASGRLRMSPATLATVIAGNVPKGGVVEVARIAGIQAAKRTSDLVPMCHPLSLSKVDVEVTETADGLRVRAEVATTGPTGVEMEALTAATVALLTLYDMCKALEKDMVIDAVRLEEKTGGRSGDWHR